MPMTDHDALVGLYHAYGDAVRAGAETGAAAWAAAWTEDAQWELPGRSVRGIGDIVALWHASMQKYTQVVQLYTSAAFDIAGDTATGRVQLVELALAADGSRTILAGHYDDAFRRTAQGWRLTKRALTIYYRGAPDLSGAFA